MASAMQSESSYLAWKILKLGCGYNFTVALVCVALGYYRGWGFGKALDG